MEEFAGLRPTGEFNRKSKVSKLQGFRVSRLKIWGFLGALGVSAVKKLRHGNGCGQLRRLTYNLADAFYHGEIERVVGAVGYFGHDVHGVEMLAHHGLGHSGAELDGRVVAGEAHLRQQPFEFLDRQQRFFSPVSPSTSATVVAS